MKILQILILFFFLPISLYAQSNSVKLRDLDIQNQIKNSRTTNFAKQEVQINKYVEIPSNTIIDGNKSIFRGKVKLNNSKKYSSQKLLEINNKKNIIIRNIVFDGGYSNQNFSKANTNEELINLIKVTNSRNITFENCTFKNFTSNWKKQNEQNFGIVGVSNSNDISFLNCNIENFQTEGLVFYKTNNIRIINLKVNSNVGWSPLHLWYCDKVFMDQAEIYMHKDAGSSITGSYSNAVFSNIKIRGGNGIQFSNERNEIPFISKNIQFLNCNIVSNTFGIGRWNYDDRYSQNITIKNCVISSHSNNTKYYWAIRLDNVIGGKIEFNKLNSVQSNSSLIGLTNVQNLTFNNNQGSGYNVFYFNMLYDVQNVNILDNTFDLIPTENLNNGVSGTFLVNKDVVNTNKPVKFNTITIKGNQISNISNGILFIQNHINNPLLSVANIKISNNVFAYSKSTSYLGNSINLSNSRNVTLENNQFVNTGYLSFTKISNFVRNSNQSINNRIENIWKIKY